MMKKVRVRSKGLLGEGHLETVLEVEEGSDPNFGSHLKVGDPIVTMFPETSTKHVTCNVVEILDEVPDDEGTIASFFGGKT